MESSHKILLLSKIICIERIIIDLPYNNLKKSVFVEYKTIM